MDGKLRYVFDKWDWIHVSFGGESGEFSSYTLYVLRIGLGDEETRRFLEAMDSDVDRLRELVDIAEQVIGYVFRGKYEKETTIYEDFRRIHTYIICTHFIIRSGDDYAYIFHVSLMNYHSLSKELYYKCQIYFSLERMRQLDEIDETTRGLMDTALRELAEIFEKPEIRQLNSPEFSPSRSIFFEFTPSVMIYENRRRFRGR